MNERNGLQEKFLPAAGHNSFPGLRRKKRGKKKDCGNCLFLGSDKKYLSKVER